MFLSLLIAAPMLLATSEAAPATAHLGPPSILTGRKRGYLATEWEQIDKDIAEGKPIAMRCKAFAPSIFSGRASSDKCELEIVPPDANVAAPAIFSGRPAKRGEVIVGARALQYYPAAAVGRSEEEAQTIAQEQAQSGGSQVYLPASAAKPKVRRYVPSMFSGRRARPAPAE